MANIELFFRGRLFYRPSGKLSLLFLLRPNPLPNLRTTSEAMFTQNSYGSGPDHQVCSRGFIYEHLVFTRDRYRSGPVPVHFWTKVRNSAACTNKLSTGRPKCVKGDRRRLNLSIRKEAKVLWPDNKLPHPCRLQNTQSFNLLLLAFKLFEL